MQRQPLARGANIAQGAYGFAIKGVAQSPLLLEAPARGWPPLEIRRTKWNRSDDPRASLDESRATLPLVTGGRVVLDRERRLAVYETPNTLSEDDLIHPYLGAAIPVFARWDGRQALHAGAFLADGRAWGLLAAREGGKSTTLAHLHLHGLNVVTDDILVIEGDRALAGPRSIDLRGDAADRLAAAEHPRPVRERARRRLQLPVGELAPRLGGFVFLEWGDELRLTRIPPRERIGRLNRFRMTAPVADDPEGLLRLAALPAWELCRPASWDVLETVARELGSLRAD